MTAGPETEVWAEIAPMLDEALGCLNDKEHDAVVLRFFEGKAFAEVGAAIGTSEDSARVRVNRAVEKLRRFFMKRGVAVSATVFTDVVTANSVQAAPAGLAPVTGTAVKGVGVSGEVATWAQSTMKTLTWLKMKFAIGVGAALLAVGGVTLVAGTEARPGFHFGPEQMLIEPKVSVGRIKANMTTNEVEAILGKPDRWENTTMVYESRYGIYVTESDMGVILVYCGLRPSTPATAKQFTGQLKEGLKIGSTREEVIKALGKPYEEHPMRNGNWRGLDLNYRKLGLQFILESGKVSQMVVFLDKGFFF